eukprot:6474649-Amphidinium_carterae.1
MGSSTHFVAPTDILILCDVALDINCVIITFTSWHISGLDSDPDLAAESHVTVESYVERNDEAYGYELIPISEALRSINRGLDKYQLQPGNDFDPL